MKKGQNSLNGDSSASGSEPTYAIGLEAPLSGQYAGLGVNVQYAVQVAVDQANASNSFGFKVKLINGDDLGDPAKAPAAATSLTQDPAVLGVIGPTFSSSVLATAKIYGSAGLAFITPSATNSSLQDQSFAAFHRIVPDDNVEGSQAADWLQHRGVKKLFVLQDLSAYGKGVADTVAAEAHKDGVSVTEQGLDAQTTTNYNPMAQTIVSSGDDAVFYGGYDAQAALLAKALQSAGFKGIAVGGNGIKSNVFTTGAGTAGNGWYMTCGCQDATVAPQSKAFAAAYQKTFNTPASTYSPESYDAANALLTAIKDAAATGAPTRAGVEAALNAIDFKGITSEIKFQSDGDVAASVQTVNLYQQRDGAITELGNVRSEN
ncbi:branched-chain amino acid ABC transporter substrate-binding protein [Catenulispora rubra]|uniref:branched-chain amino acid ABC transporter substrate-binding protein n=1 Tax=Catenulispora rubra TaxID=280293 RepID=UPI00189210FA|nr:branched-chain amino acid ABC transporter substrate-binding protein [Catenulispora rubra]